MTREQFFRLALSLPGTVADCPFAEDFDSMVFRHGAGGKWFALLVTLNGQPTVNLKCEPQKAEFWRKVCDGVQPGWHMNKTHWNTVFLARVPDDTIAEMLRDSHALTATPLSRRRRRPQ